MFRWSRAVLVAAVALFALPSAPTSAASAQTTVLFVGGYGSTLSLASLAFAPLRAALAARDSSLSYATYSYTGWSAQDCQPLDYDAATTGQDVATSERRFLDTVYALHTQCGAGRVLVIGHSLGGLIAFHALSDNPMAEVSQIVTVDSPLGGAPLEEVRACVDMGFCVDGPVTRTLADLHMAWDQTARDNTARVSRLQAAGTRVTAWGNQSDCLYSLAVCVPLASVLLGTADVPETQWLGIDRAMRRDFFPTARATLANMLNTHQIVLASAASDIAADLLS